MGKKGIGSSWLTAVKRAFRSSPSRDSDKRPAVRQDEQQQQQQDEEKKREKRRWLFRKPSVAVSDPPPPTVTSATPSPSSVRERNAAILIQTAFRGYLARRALRALRGLVKLQALIRGHNVRRQATMTLRCMQALVRVQTRVRDQRLRLLSLESSNSSFVSEARFPPEPSLSDRRSTSSVAEEYDELDEIQVLKREKERALPYAMSNQVWRSDRNLSVSDNSYNHRPRRASTDQRMPPIKTLEIDRYHHSPSTPSPARPRILQVRSASPRMAAPPAHTPRPSSYSATVPNYMAATESAKAKLRSLSTPRQRPGTPERETAAPARRRLAFAVPDSSFINGRTDLLQMLRSHGRERNGEEERDSLVSSSCNGSFLGEVSPSSTTELRRRHLRY